MNRIIKVLFISTFKKDRALVKYLRRKSKYTDKNQLVKGVLVS